MAACSPGRIEAHQRQCIEKSLHYSVHLLLLLIRPGQEDAGAYLDTVMMLFNKKRTFYKGGRTDRQAGSKPASQLAQIMTGGDCVWVGDDPSIRRDHGVLEQHAGGAGGADEVHRAVR